MLLHERMLSLICIADSFPVRKGFWDLLVNQHVHYLDVTSSNPLHDNYLVNPENTLINSNHREQKMVNNFDTWSQNNKTRFIEVTTYNSLEQVS